MKNYRIQLASNYQVIEFTLELDEDERLSEFHPKVVEAVEFINVIGKAVEQSQKETTVKHKKTETSKPAKKSTQIRQEELATDAQVKTLVGKFGLDEEEAMSMTKREAWSFINGNK